MTTKIKDHRYKLVTATQAEVDEFVRKYDHQPSVYRVRCTICDARIWYSGMGKGAHERGRRHREAFDARWKERA